MNDSSSSSICTICLDSVSEDAPRSTAKLHCGHRFHLDCIGSAFNVKGAMECPNCRYVENGEWLCPKHYSTDDDVISDYEHIFDNDYSVIHPPELHLPLFAVYDFHHLSNAQLPSNNIFHLPTIIDQFGSWRPSEVSHNSGTNGWTHDSSPASVTSCPLNPSFAPAAVPGVGRFEATSELPQSDSNLQQEAPHFDSQEIVYYRFSILPDTD